MQHCPLLIVLTHMVQDAALPSSYCPHTHGAGCRKCENNNIYGILLQCVDPPGCITSSCLCNAVSHQDVMQLTGSTYCSSIPFIFLHSMPGYCSRPGVGYLYSPLPPYWACANVILPYQTTFYDNNNNKSTAQ